MTKNNGNINQNHLALNEIGALILLISISLVIAYLIDNGFTTDFLLLLPQINGILIAGVLTSVSVAFTIFSREDIAELQKDSNNISNYNIYNQELKTDAIIVLLSFLVSILAIIVSKIQIITNILQPWFWLGIGLFFLILSIYSIYEIISSIFTLNEIKTNFLNANKKNK